MAPYTATTLGSTMKVQVMILRRVSGMIEWTEVEEILRFSDCVTGDNGTIKMAMTLWLIRTTTTHAGEFRWRFSICIAGAISIPMCRSLARHWERSIN